MSEPAVSEPAAVSEPSLISRYLAQLDILPIRGTRLVAIEFEAPDADLAAEVANAHARLFVRGGLERLYGAIEQIRSFLQVKLSELQSRLQEAEQRVLTFQSEHHLLPVDLSKDVANERLTDLSRRLTAAETERIEIEAQYRLITEGGKKNYESVPAVLANGFIQKLREELNGLEVEYALLAGKFRPTYPRRRQLDQQLARARVLLAQETAKVVKGIQERYRATQRTVERIQAEIETQRRRILDHKDDEGQLLTLMREAQTTRALHDNLLARVKDLDIAAGSDTSNITVAEPASPKLWPSTPDRPFLLTLSLLASLLVGTGLAFVRDSFDRSIRDAHELRRVTGLGTLAVIPNFEAALGESPQRWLRFRTEQAKRLAVGGWQRVVGRQRSNGADGADSARPLLFVNGVHNAPPLLLGNGDAWRWAEAYRTLRTALLLSPGAAIPRVILFASSIDIEGKTTTAVNTAAALASCGVRVLLIDGDLRLPRCHETLSLPPGPGLGEFLRWVVPEQPIQSTRVENLSFIAAGGFVQNPTELLASWRMWKLIERVRNEFDFVVIDSPPLLAVSDGLLLANLSDGVILVADKQRSRRDHVRLAVQKLLQTGIVPFGTVLNRGRAEFDYQRYSRPMPNGTGDRVEQGDVIEAVVAEPEQEV